MEVYKRSVGYEEIGRTNMLVVTATTLYFPFFLEQNLEDMGVYTDSSNTEIEILNLSGVWNLTNDGTQQKPCLNSPISDWF